MRPDKHRKVLVSCACLVRMLQSTTAAYKISTMWPVGRVPPGGRSSGRFDTIALHRGSLHFETDFSLSLV